MNHGDAAPSFESPSLQSARPSSRVVAALCDCIGLQSRYYLSLRGVPSQSYRRALGHHPIFPSPHGSSGLPSRFPPNSLGSSGRVVKPPLSSGRRRHRGEAAVVMETPQSLLSRRRRRRGAAAVVVEPPPLWLLTRRCLCC